eukprot:255103-Chlamydomonas_euryale.AAC.1
MTLGRRCGGAACTSTQPCAPAAPPPTARHPRRRISYARHCSAAADAPLRRRCAADARPGRRP